MTSKKQLTANRNNALLGGVKSPEGKAVSRYNAITHGILHQSITEYETDIYSQILDDLKICCEPVGVVEEMLVERIAIYYLKLFRVQKAETEYMKSKLNPRVTKKEGGLDYNLDVVMGKTVIVNEGYEPQITSTNINELMSIYARYEATIENRLFRALHELERTQRIRKGEKIQPSQPIDISQMGSFSENAKL